MATTSQELSFDFTCSPDETVWNPGVSLLYPQITLHSIWATCYLATHGAPINADELEEHNCLLYSLDGTPNIWNFDHKGKHLSVQVKGNLQSDNADSIIEALIQGVGITILPTWLAVPHINEGRVVQILEVFEPPAFPINAVYPQNRYVPLKVRCFIDFLKEKLEKSALVSG